MANTTISPNMGLPVPTVSVDPGPDWAENINSSLGIIDSHNHSPGQGVLINPNGMDISSDLAFNGHNATELRTTKFFPQPSPLSGSGADIGCLYESGVDLYYNDGNGNTIRLTQSGNIVGTAGSITGLPSGTASASYSSPTFTFQSATSTPASMAIGPIILGYPSPSSSTITISPTVGQSINYNLNLPIAAPAANQVLVSDGSGNLTWIGAFAQSGSFVGTFINSAGPITGTFYYSIASNGVTISPPEVGFAQVGTGGSSITGVPSLLLPISSIIGATCAISTNGGGVFQIATVRINSTGFVLFSDIGADNISNGASCVLATNSFSYVVRP